MQMLAYIGLIGSAIFFFFILLSMILEKWNKKWLTLGLLVFITIFAISAGIGVS
ncbi:hypothetical protein [Paenibacillus gallinarum]|uniref:Uncharacterized protein n=1 Tax=Paenibacillus gallinarum TaxID=2762232 RepID=A0ABR8SVM7_9BACL|nr:hypothetical protein [Paenibacillus gallinarum]MBD7967566.1 hypothetical protein [Paenibacillus gallinarum]